MATHTLSQTQQLANVANGDTINLPSMVGLPLTYFAIVTIDSSAQSITFVPQSGQSINGRSGNLNYSVVGFNVLFLTFNPTNGWQIATYAINISDLLTALNLPLPNTEDYFIKVVDGAYILGAGGGGSSPTSQVLVANGSPQVITLTSSSPQINVIDGLAGGDLVIRLPNGSGLSIGDYFNFVAYDYGTVTSIQITKVGSDNFIIPGFASFVDLLSYSGLIITNSKFTFLGNLNVPGEGSPINYWGFEALTHKAI